MLPVDIIGCRQRSVRGRHPVALRHGGLRSHSAQLRYSGTKGKKGGGGGGGGGGGRAAILAEIAAEKERIQTQAATLWSRMSTHVLDGDSAGGCHRQSCMSSKYPSATQSKTTAPDLIAYTLSGGSTKSVFGTSWSADEIKSVCIATLIATKGASGTGSISAKGKTVSVVVMTTSSPGTCYPRV
ncbi:hypothetical protein HDU67_001833 [Dinochytrium kinnereticum]|nr:hypothetical protein HDU67_001833 [Dinochytrium kinnereticum]